MAGNPGSEAEAAKTPSPGSSDAAPDPLASAAADAVTQTTPPPSATPPPLVGAVPARNKITQNSAAIPSVLPTPSPLSGPARNKITQTSPALSGATPPTIPASLKISGGYPIADPSIIGPNSLSTPTPLTSRGLHAPATTPGPLVQQFVTLGRYQLLSRLAVGGMAEVYLARQGELSGFKTLVVVKKVLPHLAVKPDFIAMFLDEARIASMLDHPNIVRITEVGRAGDEYFLAMELVQGRPLASMLQHAEKAQTPLPHNLAALIVANAAAGLHHAHELTDASGHPLGLVHRDISPQNIMVSFEGSVKVIDFGIARALGRLGDTNSGSLKGKLGYMAPEQARGETVDARADLFSLGVVLWECVAGRRLFLRENELATLRAVVYEPIPSVSKHVEVDPALDAIVRRSVARNIEERFQTAEEMRIALERWVFSCGGASTHDLASLMKSWFPADHVQWQRAARLALDMQESDPPIEVAFPNLSTGKTGHSRTGAGSDSALRFRAESSSRSYRPPTVGAPAAETVQSPPKSWLRFAVPAGIGLSLLGAFALILALSNNKPPLPTAPESKPSSVVRPTVEILPGGEGAQGGQSEPVPPSSSAPAVPNAVVPPRDTEAPRQNAESAAVKKKHVSRGEKRAILRTHDRGSNARPKPNAPSGINKNPRPNPF